MNELFARIAGLEEAARLVCHRCEAGEMIIRDEETGEVYHPWGSHIDGEKVCEAYPIHDRIAELRATPPYPSAAR